jgi:hypothetical protein
MDLPITSHTPCSSWWRIPNAAAERGTPPAWARMHVVTALCEHGSVDAVGRLCS